MASPNYYENVNYGNYQPYNVAGTVFGTPTGPYPTQTNVEQNAGFPAPTEAGTGGQPGSLFHPPSWLAQPADAVDRAMRMAGMNPASFSPVAQQIRRNAGNLSASLFGQVAGGGVSQMPDVSNDDLMLGKLRDLVQGAASGQQVFGGYDPAKMANFSTITAAANNNSTQLGVPMMAEYLYNPTNAMNLAQSLLYSGLSPQYQRAAAAPLANLTDYYQNLLEKGQSYDRSIIDVLLGAPVYGHAPGSQGVPLPFQGSAWRYF